MTMRELKGPKKKLEYFWMYYKIPFFVVAGICVAVLYFGYAKLTEKEPALEAILYDIHTDASEESLEEEFASRAGIDTKEYDVSISTSLLLSDTSSGSYAMASLSKMYTDVGTGDLDVCMLLEEDFENYKKADIFVDLRELFSDEELEAFGKLYVDSDGSVLGVYADFLSKIDEIGGYEGESAVAGILYNSPRQEAAKQFLEYLLDGSDKED